jgi:ATP-dependent RNA helicase DDX27
MGYSAPTPIQALAIPVLLQGKDVCGSARTGSGKTAAFMLPILERLLYRNVRVPLTRVLVLSPTRELATQIHSMTEQLAQFTDIRACLAVGGLATKAQEAVLRQRPDIVVATPGRIIDHLRNSVAIHLEDLEILVLDEADRYVVCGHMFGAHVLKCPVVCRVQVARARLRSRDAGDHQDGAAWPSDHALLCHDVRGRQEASRPLAQPPSALAPPTASYALPMCASGTAAQLCWGGKVRLGVENFKQVVPSKLRQEFVRIRPVHEADREAMLFALLSRSFTKRCIVFVQTKWHAHRLRLLCGLFGLRASELHGNLTQLQRLEALQQFKDEEVDILVATGLAARGLDVNNVQAVINFQMPRTVEEYIHRVGRTARAGTAPNLRLRPPTESPV